MAHVTLGPFLTKVQQRWRDHVVDHEAARREVFRLVDLNIGRQLVPMAKALEKKDCSYGDILTEGLEAHEKANVAWVGNKRAEAVKHLMRVATSAIYVLESFEAEMQRDQEPD